MTPLSHAERLALIMRPLPVIRLVQCRASWGGVRTSGKQNPTGAYTPTTLDDTYADYAHAHVE